MAQNRNYTWPIVTVVIAVALVLVALPQSAKQWAPGFIRNTDLHFGLDLAGGTQLDFRISESELNEQIQNLEAQVQSAQGTEKQELELQLATLKQQKLTIVEAIRTVLERRINALGVSEAVITPSYFGDEKHLLVECPGVVDVQKCIETVGKTIQLEFKEEFTEASEEYTANITAKADAAQNKILNSGSTLKVVAEDLSSDQDVFYADHAMFFEDQLPPGFQTLWEKGQEAGVVRIESTIKTPFQTSDGQVQVREDQGIYLAEVIKPLTQTGRTINQAPKAFAILDEREENVEYIAYDGEQLSESGQNITHDKVRTMQAGDLETITVDDSTAKVLFLQSIVPGNAEISASHILVAYQGAFSAGEDVTRTKEEAEQIANSIGIKLQNGESFEELAKNFSDGPSGKDGGSLGSFTRDQMVEPFSNAAFELQNGEISPITETQFGYHIIRADSNPIREPDVAKYHELVVTGENPTTKAEALITTLENGDVKTVEPQAHIRYLFFSMVPSGWKDTELDGRHFRSATVTLDEYSRPVVQINFTSEGGQMFADLTGKNKGKRIAIFVGGQIVSAPTVNEEITGGSAVITGSRSIEEARILAQDLNTGAIPAPIYLSGQRTVEATLGADALKTSLEAAIIGILILMAYMLVVYRLLGLIANIALACYAIIFFAMLKLPLFLFSDQYIVLTLAGMAGIILSIGMAVDANVLIFERMKEELRKGKMLKTAASTGFERAWPSIRDGNFSTLITCSILFMIGTSIVRGFAVTLGMGVLLSMFSAIVITRWLLTHLADSPLSNRPELFGISKKNSSDS